MNNNPIIIEKSSVEQVQVAETEFGGKKLIDIRIYWMKSETETIPTKKGISLGIDKLDELVAALTKIKGQLSS